MKSLFLACLALSLAGCSAEALQVGGDAETDAGATATTRQEPSGEGQADGADAAATSDTDLGPDEAAVEADAQADAIARGDAAKSIPADFQGSWDYVEGSCDPASDLRMKIEGTQIVFYESVGRVESVDRADDGSLVVDLAMSGEGESWSRQLKLEMDSTASRMVVGDPQQSGPQPYSARKRCP